MVNVYGLDRKYVELTDFDREEDDLAPLSMLDDESMAAQYLDELAPAGVPDKLLEGQLPAEFMADVMAFGLGLAKAAKLLEHEADELKAWENAIAAKRHAREKRLGHLRAYLRSYIDGWGVKLKDVQISAWTAKTNPSVEVTDPAEVPDEYVRVILEMPRAEVPEGYEKDITDVKIGKAEILAAIKETGEAIPGVNVINNRRHVVVR